VTDINNKTPVSPDDPNQVAQAAPAQELLTEAASLLKSLRLPTMKAMRISSLEVQTGGRTLLMAEPHMP